MIIRENDEIVDNLEATIMQFPDELIEGPLVHRFTEGMYIREIFMPAETLWTSKIHKVEHPYVVSYGKAAVSIDAQEWYEITAPYTGITQPGTRRVLYILEDCIWTTFHRIDGMKSEYNNLSEEEKIKAREALDYLKSIEDKMNNNDVATLDPVKQPELTGPGGFTVKKTVEENTLKSQNTEKNQKEELKIPTTIHDAKLIESINENKKTQNIFNMLINIFIFVFIGILIILLCDYIAELAIQIGSTKTANTLEPYIKYQMLYMQNMANNTSMMQNMQGSVNTIPGMTNIPGTIPLPTGMQVVQNIPYPILKN